MHDMLNLEVDGLQQQKATSGSASVCQEEEPEATEGTETGQLKIERTLPGLTPIFSLNCLNVSPPPIYLHQQALALTLIVQTTLSTSSEFQTVFQIGIS